MRRPGFLSRVEGSATLGDRGSEVGDDGCHMLPVVAGIKGRRVRGNLGSRKLMQMSRAKCSMINTTMQKVS